MAADALNALRAALEHTLYIEALYMCVEAGFATFRRTSAMGWWKP